MTTKEWARFGLTGDKDFIKPIDAQLDPLLESFTLQMVDEYPCIGPDPEMLSNTADVEAWHEWAGASIAAYFITSIPGAKFLIELAGDPGILEKEEDGVRIRYQSATGKATDPASIASDLLTRAEGARKRIGCIKSASIKPAGKATSLFTVAGRRRGLNKRGIF